MRTHSYSLRRMTLSTKVILLSMLAVTVTAGAIWITVSRQTWSQMEARQRTNGERNLRTLALVLAARVEGAAADLDGARVARVSTPSLSGFADAGVVDDAVAYSGGLATVFSYEPASDSFVRRQTTVRREDGTRAVGTALAADSPAQAAIRAGRTYEGPAALFGRRYYTVYHPTVDTTGKVNGILFVGLPIEMYFDAHAQTMTSLSVAALVIAVLASALVGLAAARVLGSMFIASSFRRRLGCQKSGASVKRRSSSASNSVRHRAQIAQLKVPMCFASIRQLWVPPSWAMRAI
ncbi:Cache 3/Cache 2 fusion domain-containing protein, partial [Methylobacterium organophilum]|nr:Cache 3/Cache 2 fusion domain-containing protein [Methylobacterium organophilum]